MLNFGDTIYSILSQYTGLTQYINNRIYPIVAPVNASKPLVVYVLNGERLDSKEYYTADNLTLTLINVSSDYELLRKINAECINALHYYSGEVSGFNVISSEFSSFGETYDIEEEVYLCTLNFNMIVQDNG